MGFELTWLDWTVGVLAVAGSILFGVSYLTLPPRREQIASTTVNWGEKWEAFQGITDWRLHLAVLSIVTMLCYWWLW